MALARTLRLLSMSMLNLALALALAGCQAAPAATPTATSAPPATATASPTATATALPTATAVPPTATPLPTATPTTAPSPTPSQAPEPTTAPTTEEPSSATTAPDGWVRHTSESLGVSIALPPEWACINHDPGAEEESLAALKARTKNDTFGLFDMAIAQLFTQGDEWEKLHCLYDPDMNTFMDGTFTMCHVGANGQSGFTDALSLANYGPECTPSTFTIQGRDAASALCISPDEEQPIVFSIDVLDGARHVQVAFRTFDETLVPQFEAIRDTVQLE